MKRAGRVPFNIWSLALLFAVWSCGRGGSGKSGDDDDDGGGGGGVVQPGAKDVSGHFFYGTTATPAFGSEVWAFDLTDVTRSVYSLGEDGSFTVALTSYHEDHVYSFHLVRDFQLIGDVDLSAASAGAQTAFTYQGGYGFDLGDVVVPLDRHGGIDVSAGPLSGAVGGGFSLLNAVDGTFAKFPLPSYVTTVSVGSQLDVTDASVLLNSFYKRATNGSAYGRDLASWSRVGVLIVTADADTLDRTFADEGGNLLKAARLASSTDSPARDSPLWSATAFELVKQGDRHWRAGAYVGTLPNLQSILVLKVTPKTGPQATVPRAIDVLVAMTPQVVAASTSGNTPTAIDYTSPTAANGLTKPYCQTGDVTLTLQPPLDQNGASIPATRLNAIDAEFDYFPDLVGEVGAISPDAAHLGAPYNKAHTGTDLPDITTVWDPALYRLRFELGTTAGGATSQTIKVPATFFPSSVGGTAVGKVRLRLYYRSETDATEGGVVFWLDKTC